MKQFYTYLHCKPNGEPFYVGKGCDGRIKRSHDFRPDRRNAHHRRVIEKHGSKNIGVFVFPCESEQQAFNDEIRQIAQLRRDGYVLANMTDGGEGPSGWHPTSATREKLAAGSVGNKNATGNKSGCGRRGAQFSIQHRKRLSVAGQNRPSETYRKKLIASEVKIIQCSKLNTSVLAKTYGVCRTSIQRIRSGKVWKKL